MYFFIDLDLMNFPMTLILKLDVSVLKMNILALVVLKLQPEQTEHTHTCRQKDRQTDRQTNRPE